MTRRDELLAMVAAATPGPWTHHETDDWTVSDEVRGGGSEVVCCNTKFYPTGVSRENCRLIAQAPTIATELAAALAEVERLRAAVTTYHLALDRREHGGIAGSRLVDAVQGILGMPWCQGQALAALTPQEPTEYEHKLAQMKEDFPNGI